MEHDTPKVQDTKAWLAKAAVDLRAAELDRTADPPITPDIVFHAQQLAEKTLKAFLTWHDLPFRKTHNLVQLGEQCVRIAPNLEPILQQAATLTEYAWKFRYPGDPDVPPTEEAEEALSLARNVYRNVLNLLPAKLHPQEPMGGP